MPTAGQLHTEQGRENEMGNRRSSSGESSGTPLDRTIDRIGMGGYQYALLCLCGLGWAADNMWLQAVAIALPRVHVQYGIPSSQIGYLSASTFCGMMLGALLWGTLSDLLGRIAVFNLTLSLSALFGFFAFWVDTFPSLCVANFLLGTAVGGSMPTDGTFALETLPRAKRHLLTSLSVFFSIGSVMAALVAILVIPSHSCPSLSHESSSTEGISCDVHKDNNGWKYLFLVLAVITAVMALARILFFSLHESPRFLVHSGRKEEAALALAKIAKFNGEEFRITVADVNDDEEYNAGTHSSTRLRHSLSLEDRPVFADEEGEALLESPILTRARSTSPILHRRSLSRTSTYMPSKPKTNRILVLLRKWLATPLKAWYARIAGLLSGEWRNRTLLIWAIWMTLSLAYTMFNVFLPTLLEYRSKSDSKEHNDGDTASSLSGPLWEVVIFTIGGCPGSLIGGYLVDNASRFRLSKSLVLAAVTFITGGSCLAFVLVSEYYAVVLTTVGMSLASTAMWSILYGTTPELFITEVRGTASGTASALSRVGGIMAPLIGSVLVSINPTLLVLASFGVFVLSGILLIMLHQTLKDIDSPVSTPPVDNDA